MANLKWYKDVGQISFDAAGSILTPNYLKLNLTGQGLVSVAEKRGFEIHAIEVSVVDQNSDATGVNETTGIVNFRAPAVGNGTADAATMKIVGVDRAFDSLRTVDAVGTDGCFYSKSVIYFNQDSDGGAAVGITSYYHEETYDLSRTDPIVLASDALFGVVSENLVAYNATNLELHVAILGKPIKLTQAALLELTATDI